ncbi:MAG: lytic transglycosylase domain-containing protein [Candidatus Kapabacteria bacterium]|nr:lytic transglycosylase domain-containing protein [Candidatus Kapabacteria bacterium]
MHIHLQRFVVAAAVAAASSLLISCSETAHSAGSSSEPPRPLPISTWKLPDSLSFCGERVPLNIPEVRERAEREFYMNLQTPGQIILYLKRSARYFPMYQRILKEMNAPQDLRFLSVAESALFMARSSKDAVGLWQFMAATARDHGLQVDEDVDERRHPERSTRAAVKYLRAGYDSNGSWTDAAAGYNMGHTSYAKSREFQSGRSFYDCYLNEETSRYVLRIAVIKHIMEHAHDYGIIVPANERYQADKTKRIRVTTAIDNLANWASTNGTTYKDVKLLNPWILGRKLPAPAREAWEIDIPI